MRRMAVAAAAAKSVPAAVSARTLPRALTTPPAPHAPPHRGHHCQSLMAPPAPRPASTSRSEVVERGSWAARQTTRTRHTHKTAQAHGGMCARVAGSEGEDGHARVGLVVVVPDRAAVLRVQKQKLLVQLVEARRRGRLWLGLRHRCVAPASYRWVILGPQPLQMSCEASSLRWRSGPRQPELAGAWPCPWAALGRFCGAGLPKKKCASVLRPLAASSGLTTVSGIELRLLAAEPIKDVAPAS